MTSNPVFSNLAVFCLLIISAVVTGAEAVTRAVGHEWKGAAVMTVFCLLSLWAAHFISTEE